MRTTALALLLSAALATPALAGPPWLTVEVRPMGAAFLVVHTFHHGTANPMALTGTAQGLVNGRRISVPLSFSVLPESPAAYAVAKSWGDDGVWVLNIATADTGHMGAAAVVMIDKAGNATVSFPRVFDGRSRTASGAEITTLLRALDAGEPPPALASTGWAGWAFRLAVPLFILVLVVVTAAKLVEAVVARLKAARSGARAGSAAATTALLLVALLAAGPVVAGAPWISVELPANPMDPATRGAFAVVRTYRHADPMPFVVTGSAEGLVAGQRRSQPMRIVATNLTGRMAIMKTWPNDGVWVLKLGVDGMQMDAAIGVGADGEVAFVRVPTTRSGGPRQLSGSEVEGMLRALAAGDRAPALAATH